MTGKASVRRTPIVGDDRAKDVLQRLLHVAVHVEKRFTVDQLAEAAGLSTPAVSSYLSRREDAQRQASLGSALSIAVVLGERAVNQILALIGYGGAEPLDEASADCPLQSGIASMQQLSVFLTAAADGRIDHVEEEGATRAADIIIAELLPFSSTGRAS